MNKSTSGNGLEAYMSEHTVRATPHSAALLVPGKGDPTGDGALVSTFAVLSYTLEQLARLVPPPDDSYPTLGVATTLNNDFTSVRKAGSYKIDVSSAVGARGKNARSADIAQRPDGRGGAATYT
ncbi:hypothetical protein B0A55_08669 [Friedmanniomyces simplex]|uniref:Uncharacterized protein n=1 Tax=Friedmanniomyces simplex TaxID=329884 RepID=A0A4U0X6H5_9PEZI|nr:hypothetical protein B0A55_08669 [Friedmanniomyces simplex]